MSTSHFYLCAVPSSVWQQPGSQNKYGIDVASFVADALGCERRIRKGVNVENEFSRYSLCCNRIEQAISMSKKLVLVDRLGKEFPSAIRSGKIPYLIVDADYLSVIALSVDNSGPERLGASFHTPESVKPHRIAFAQWVKNQGIGELDAVHRRLEFLRAAEKEGCGVIEIQSGFFVAQQEELGSPGLDADIDADTTSTKQSNIPNFLTEEITVASLDKNTRAEWKVTLQKQIREALKTGTPVTFGNQAPHDVITEVLNELVYLPKGRKPHSVEIRIAYADGSEAEPFPLFCLRKTYVKVSLRKRNPSPLRVALMSMRHLEMDSEIDFCWFRNRDVSRTRTLAETDQFCYETTLKQLQECLNHGSLFIHLYHTGFEPAVLGFYRAVAHTLQKLAADKQTHKLVIQPFYYRGPRKYEDGSVWH